MAGETATKKKASSTKKAPVRGSRSSSRAKTTPERFIHEEEPKRGRKRSASSSSKKSKSPSPKKQKKSKSPTKKRAKSPASKSKSPKKSASPKKAKSPKKKSPSPGKKSPKKSASPKKRASKKKEESEESKESASEEESEEEEKKPRGKKRSSSSKKSGSSKSSLSKLKDDVKEELMGMNIPDLKKRLQANDQVVGGTKGEVQERIADCIANGCLPRCPKCFGGKIKKDKSGYYCPGSYDDDKFVSCSWKGKDTDISRPVWKIEAGKLV